MIIAWIIIGYLLLFIPIAELLTHRQYRKQIAANTFKKQAFYNSVLIELWAPVVGVFLLMLQGQIKLEDIGLNAIIWNPFGISQWLLVSAITVAIIPILLVGLSIYNFVGIKSSPAFREAYLAAVRQQQGNEGQEDRQIIYSILPQGLPEKIHWLFVSLTAGITEEILFRGFLVFFIHHLFPGLPLPLLYLLQAIPFALMHLYQGVQGVKTSLLMGIVFGIYVIVSGSIIPGIIVHALLDLTASLIEREQSHTGNPDR